MSTTKQELLSKFASQTGADLPGVQSKSSNSTNVHINTEVEGTEIATTQEEELFKDSFSDRTKVPPWQNPRYKGLIVASCVLPFVMGVGWIFKDGIPKPKFDAKAPKPTAAAQDPDEDQPKPATDGEWASYAATNGMRQQFANASESENTDALKKFQDQNGSQKKTQGSSSTAQQNTRSAAPVTTGTTTPSYRTVSRSYTAPTPIRREQTNTPSYRTVSRSYTPVTPSFSTNQYRTVAPTIRTVKPPALTANQSSAQLQSQRSPQERVAAIISATSAEAGSEAKTVATAIPSESGVSLSSTTRSLAPQSTYISPQQTYLSSESALIDGQPQRLIERSQSAKGVLLTSIAFTSGDYASLANQPVEIKLAEALGDIPKGARIGALVEATQSNYSDNKKSQVVRLKPTVLVVDNVEIPLPDGAIVLAGKKGAPLVAKRGGSNFLRFIGGLVGTVAGGAGLTNFGAAQNVQIGNSSYFQSIGANVATSLVSNAAQQLQQVGEGGEILILKVGSSVTVSVHKPFVLPQISDTQRVGRQLSEALPELAFQSLADTVAMQELADFKGAADATQN